ncbi:MAG: hypothetical protein BMS9Abin02_1946 [Anaerolineae bacterium]|nr:MAG: hypothetical protein BMS9Abin02_1946 [Anaerolineae bacterium]
MLKMIKYILTLFFFVGFMAKVIANDDSDKVQTWAEEYYNQFKNSTMSKYVPKSGVIPDEKTAISIAVSVWKPIYGDEQIEKQKPYQAFLIDGNWIVLGTLPNGELALCLD